LAEGGVGGDEQVLGDLLQDLRAELGDAWPLDGLAGRRVLLVDLDAELLVALVGGGVLAGWFGGGDRCGEGSASFRIDSSIGMAHLSFFAGVADALEATEQREARTTRRCGSGAAGA
jgi:hypothetical protein